MRTRDARGVKKPEGNLPAKIVPIDNDKMAH